MALDREAHCLVVSVADVFLPPSNDEEDDTSSLYVPAGVKRAHEHAAREVARARELAETAKAKVAKLLTPPMKRRWYDS